MGTQNDRDLSITAESTVLDIVSDYPETVKVFSRYDNMAGECICCEMLFSTLGQVAEHYDLNLAQLLADLSDAH